MLRLEAASRDGDGSACPHSLPSRQPNSHVTFGFGPHRCRASVAGTDTAAAPQALLQALAEVRRSG